MMQERASLLLRPHSEFAELLSKKKCHAGKYPRSTDTQVSMGWSITCIK